MSTRYAIDLHVHSAEGSLDAQASAAEMVLAGASAQLDGICLTTKVVPDELRQQSEVASLSSADLAATLRRGYDAARAVADGIDGAPAIYFGMEYRIPRTFDDVLVLGLEPEALASVDLLRADPWDLRRFVVERGGLLCSAHPFRHRNHGAPFGGPNMVEGVEVLNGRRDLNNRNDLAARWCQKIDGVAVAGSDAHAPDGIGEAVTVLDSLPGSTRELGSALRRGRSFELQRRNYLWLGLQSCRLNGLFVEDELRHAARQGLSAFEIFFDNFMPGEVDARARARFRSMAAGMGLRLSVLAPLVSFGGGHGRQLCQELVAFTAEVGARLLVIPAASVDDAAMVTSCVRQASERGVAVAIGNGPDYDRRCSPQCLADAVARVPGSQAALDLGYAHLHSHALDYTEELLERLEPIAGQVVHLQLHDNDGAADGHLSLGDGNLPLDACLQRLFRAGFDGAGIIEHWRDVSREIEQIRDMVQRIRRPHSAVDLQRLAEAATA